MPALEDNPLDNQPDFDRITELDHGIAQQNHEIGNEWQKFKNTPQFDANNMTVNNLRELKEMVQELGLITNNLGVQARASEHNRNARVQNSSLRTASDSLSTFVDRNTNHLIQGFPNKPQDIARLADAQLDRLLTELGLATDGAKPRKQHRLRVHIGLPKDPGP